MAQGRADASASDRFRTAVIGVRWGTAGVGVVLALTQRDGDGFALAWWCAVILAIALYRTWRPVQVDRSIVGISSLLAETALTLVAVNATGHWESPFVFSLITAIIVAGFARGLVLAAELALTLTIAVAVPFAAAGGPLRTSGQWGCEFVLVALVAGYSRRITGEAAQEQSRALGELGRLADANALLVDLHRLAQSLASLDLEETLDSTIGRLRDLFDFSAAVVLLRDEADGTWHVSRREGCRLPSTIKPGALPPPLLHAVNEPATTLVSDLSDRGGPGLVPRMNSGLYVALRARGSVIGLVAIEHEEPDRYDGRTAELLTGFAQPAALAVDNARWFSRLRTVGAEEERTRIARDLHDRIGQSLAYVAFELDRIVKADGKGDAVGPSLDRLRSDLRDVISEVRDTLYDLRTDVSERSDLPSVLSLYGQRVSARSGIAITVRADASARLPLPQERELFRIAQEALTNVEKHASASHVTLTYRCDGANAMLDVTDDGVGLPAGQLGRPDSYGIVGMRERALGIGAQLDVASTAGAGTKVRCTVGEPSSSQGDLLGDPTPAR
ncbi:MAG: GAF domain-containing sensor histidine kinase [Acidimicrobiales bacterium]